MKKSNIVIIIPCWGRSEVFNLVVKQLDELYYQVKLRVEITVLYVLSPEDQELNALLNTILLANHTNDVVFSDNSRLGQKINDGIEHASRFNYDYIMNCGSDDLLHPALIKLYIPLMYASTPLFGISALHFYKKNEVPISFSYYNNPHVIGAGRCIHRRVIDRVTEVYGGLYDPDCNRGMDTMSAKRMKSLGFNELVVYRGNFPYIVDIKSEVNINNFEEITKASNWNRYIKSSLSDLEREFKVLQAYK